VLDYDRGGVFVAFVIQMIMNNRDAHVKATDQINIRLKTHSNQQKISPNLSISNKQPYLTSNGSGVFNLALSYNNQASQNY
jgi:hypothetical protein